MPANVRARDWVCVELDYVEQGQYFHLRSRPLGLPCAFLDFLSSPAAHQYRQLHPISFTLFTAALALACLLSPSTATSTIALSQTVRHTRGSVSFPVLFVSFPGTT